VLITSSLLEVEVALLLEVLVLLVVAVVLVDIELVQD
jgi:hypothetical protein